MQPFRIPFPLQLLKQSFNVICAFRTFSQRTYSNPSFPQVSYKESVEYENKEEKMTVEEQNLAQVEEPADYEALITTAKPPTSRRDGFKNLVTKTSFPLPSSRLTVTEIRRPYSARPAAVTEPTSKLCEENYVGDRTPSHVEENNEEEVVTTAASMFLRFFKNLILDSCIPAFFRHSSICSFSWEHF